MKLATLKNGAGRDGILIVVDRKLERYCAVSEIAPTLQFAIENWFECEGALNVIYNALNLGTMHSRPLDISQLASPLPRAYQWLDGSAYLSHVERVRRARGAEMPPSFLEDPLMYQGGSDFFIGPRDNIYAADISCGVDMEAEVAVVVGDIPEGSSAAACAEQIKLLMLVNDVSFRNLIPSELAKGFGFLHGKPPTAFSPVAVTPDELEPHWRDNKLHLPLTVRLNGALLGEPDAGDDMQFDFGRLLEHASKTRPLTAGTILGSGTVSNRDLSRGCCCLAEKRVLEIIDQGEASTPFMQYGDEVEIEMLSPEGQSLFGKIQQQVQPWTS